MQVHSVTVHIRVVPTPDFLFPSAGDVQDGELLADSLVCGWAICHLANQLDSLANDRLCGFPIS
jgi:hypothetical protein